MISNRLYSSPPVDNNFLNELWMYFKMVSFMPETLIFGGMETSPTDMPDFDGEYLCYIVRYNECGTKTGGWRVVLCAFNEWVLNDIRGAVTHWMQLPETP